MGWRWVLGVVVAGLVAGCGGTTGGRGTPDTAVSAPGLPVPSDPTEPPATSATPPPTTRTPATTPAARACPADVVATLPGPATLVAGFGTTRFRLYFCRTEGGQLYYRGISRADPTQATTIAASTIPGGYQARKVVDGHLFVYRVVARRLLVTRDGKQILTDPVTSTL